MKKITVCVKSVLKKLC